MRSFAIYFVLSAGFFVHVVDSACQICGCSFCPDDWTASKPEALMLVPDNFKPLLVAYEALLPPSYAENGTVPCGTIDLAASTGVLDQYCDDSLRLNEGFRTACGCPEAIAPTDPPTVGPTPNPSGSPTKGPTKSPVADPTEAPTKFPTSSPTKAPVVSPTDAPTTAPVVSPTAAPTKAPVVNPTDAPTKAPVVNPTDTPTKAPVVNPTDTPTEAPVVNPTDTPTEAPVVNPTDAPTKAPVVSPTDSPTISPTEAAQDEALVTSAPVPSPTSQAPVPSPTTPAPVLPVVETVIYIRLENAPANFTKSDQDSFIVMLEDYLNTFVKSATDLKLKLIHASTVTRRYARSLATGNVELAVSISGSTTDSAETLQDTVMDAVETKEFTEKVRSVFKDVTSTKSAAAPGVPASSGKGKGGKSKKEKSCKKSKKSKTDDCEKSKKSKKEKGSGKGERNLRQEQGRLSA